MLKQCLAGILAGVALVLFGLLGSEGPVLTQDNYRGGAAQVEGTRLAVSNQYEGSTHFASNTRLSGSSRLAEGQMAEIVAGKKKINWWAVAGTTLAVVGITVACLSGVGLVGAAAALVTGAATTGEVVFAGTAFLAGLGAATTGSAICDSAGC